MLVALLAGLLGAWLRPVGAGLDLNAHRTLQPGSLVHVHVHDAQARLHPAAETCCTVSAQPHAHTHTHTPGHGDGAQPLSWALPPGAPCSPPEDRRRSAWACYDQPFLPDPLPADLLRPPRASV